MFHIAWQSENLNDLQAQFAPSTQEGITWLFGSTANLVPSQQVTGYTNVALLLHCNYKITWGRGVFSLCDKTDISKMRLKSFPAT